MDRSFYWVIYTFVRYNLPWLHVLSTFVGHCWRGSYNSVDYDNFRSGKMINLYQINLSIVALKLKEILLSMRYLLFYKMVLLKITLLGREKKVKAAKYFWLVVCVLFLESAPYKTPLVWLPILQTIQVRRTRFTGDCSSSRDELISEELHTLSHQCCPYDKKLIFINSGWTLDAKQRTY